MTIRQFLFFLFAFASTSLAAQTDPLRYVDPFIGTGGHGHTFPGPCTPFGMVQLSPDTRPDPTEWDGCSGYHDSDDKIYGFSHTHLSGTGVPDYCDVLIMPFTGAAPLQNEEYASGFDKESERAEPGYYRVYLDKYQIEAELTATERVGVHRYTFPGNTEKAQILIDLRHRDKVLDSRLEFVNSQEIEGRRISRSWAQEQHLYFVVRFSRPFFSAKLLDLSATPSEAGPYAEGAEVLGLLEFPNDTLPLVVTVGISAVSPEGARRNLEAECNHFDFEAVRERAQQLWRDQLSKIRVSGGSEARKRVFYTALYHCLIAPNLFSDTDGKYRGRDLQVHQSNATDVYTVFSLWDTYRATHPLFTLLDPDRVNDFIRTFLLQYEQGGLLPVWELAANETNCMIGNHAIPVIADAWSKGIRNYDGQQALEAMIKSANLARLGLADYRQRGYIPSDRESESVSKTLEYAFDDWCIAQMAGALADTANQRRFLQRSLNYRNLFDPESRFFRAKSNGSWHQPFDPYEVNFNYTEANAWQYRFGAQHDISGMMRLHGGEDAFAAAIDQLFEAETGTTGRNQADITGLIGQYVQGNEPSHHMAYLYNYAGMPWKTQERVRQIMDELYSDAPDGLSGNEDCGQMSAWLVFSALGLYPVVPAGGDYVIGTPWFEEAVLQLPDGKDFAIRAPGVSAEKKYIAGAVFNDQLYHQTWINHRQIAEGGVLAFAMTDKPAAWGANAAACPKADAESQAFVPVPFVAAGSRVFEGKQEIALACLIPEAEIFFKILPDDKWKAFKKPVSIREDTRMAFRARHQGVFSLTDTAEFSSLRTDLRLLRYNTHYDNQYTGRGENGLIDRIRGGADFRSGGWQGFQGTDMDVVFDLGKIRPLERISAGFLQDENSWIFFPEAVRLEVSTDGTNFREIATLECDISPDEPGSLRKDFEYRPENVRARYLRVIAKSLGVCPEWHKGAGHPAWIFADEVEVQ